MSGPQQDRRDSGTATPSPSPRKAVKSASAPACVSSSTPAPAPASQRQTQRPRREMLRDDNVDEEIDINGVHETTTERTQQSSSVAPGPDSGYGEVDDEDAEVLAAARILMGLRGADWGQTTSTTMDDGEETETETEIEGPGIDSPRSPASTPHRPPPPSPTPPQQPQQTRDQALHHATNRMLLTHHLRTSTLPSHITLAWEAYRAHPTPESYARFEAVEQRFTEEIRGSDERARGDKVRSAEHEVRYRHRWQVGGRCCDGKGGMSGKKAKGRAKGKGKEGNGGKDDGKDGGKDGKDDGKGGRGKKKRKKGEKKEAEEELDEDDEAEIEEDRRLGANRVMRKKQGQ